MSLTWLRPSEITFIRHAESHRNVILGNRHAFRDDAERVRFGSYRDEDVPLTDLGREQSRISGPRLMAEIGRPDCVYHSDYLRAEETMQYALEHLSEVERLKIREYHRFDLGERNPGYGWYLTVTELDQTFPWLADYHAWVSKFKYTPPGGESIEQLTRRVRPVIDSVFRERCGLRVWIFCHGHVLRASRAIFERTRRREMEAMICEPVPNVAVLRYTYALGETTPVRTHLYCTYY